jgi:hypothetical protein
MSRDEIKKIGDVRRSQVLHASGVGAVLDLPQMSGMVLGLHRWEAPNGQTTVQEDRLLAIVRQHLGPQVERLCLPPTPRGDGRDPLDPENLKGVPVVPFPNWLRCPRCELLARRDSGHFSLEHNAYRTDRTRFVHTHCSRGRSAATPARFVVACEKGHIDDFPWHEYLGCATGERCGPLQFQESGVSAEVADLWVVCNGCNKRKSMIEAFGEDRKLPPCPGKHPHLGSTAEAPCGEPTRTMLVGASNLWFGIASTALSLPTQTGRLESLVEKHWPVLEKATTREILGAFRAVGNLGAFESWTDDELWQAIEQKRNRAVAPTEAIVDLKIAEWRAFSQPAAMASNDDFRLTEVEVPKRYAREIQQVVLVEKLRVVKALTGFTRIQSPGDFADPSEIPQQIRVPLTRGEPTWVPAAEVRGEGVFLRLHEAALEDYVHAPELKPLRAAFLAAHVRFRRAREIEPAHDHFPGLRYVLLHTLSHLLIRQFAIECGYSAASVAERIYSREPDDPNGPMAGILLYTAAADSEGTLGGLVALGQPRELERHLTEALRRATLCSSDPLCAEHPPIADARTLHAGACHACSFVSETSCERGNKFLDRNLVVATMAERVPSFFPRERYES